MRHDHDQVKIYNRYFRQWRNRRVFGCSVAGDKNYNKIFDSTLGKLVQTSVIEGQKIFNGPPPKAGIGKIVKSGLFSRYGMQKIFADSFDMS